MKTYRFAPVFLGTIIFVTVPAIARAASLQITEVMYDYSGSDTGREWIELYNPGDAPVAMTAGTHGWKLSDGSNHNLVDPAGGVGQGSLTVAAHTFAILANDPATFLGLYPGSYAVIKSAFSLNNTGATISLADDTGAVVDSVSYTKDLGAAGDGNSLHRSGGTLVAGAPDPGVFSSITAPADTSSNTPTSSASGSDATTSASGDSTTSVADTNAATDSNADSSSADSASGPPQTTSTINAPPLAVHITATSPVVVGAGSAFAGSASTAKGGAVTNARYVWNFGDGVTSEGQKVFHTYMYPGSYALSLSVSQGYSMGTGYTTLQAVPAQLSLQAQADGSAVLSNASSQNANVGLWSIGPSAGAFIIPENTTVLAKQSIRFAPAVMRFSANASTSLFYPNGTQAATSGAPAPAAASVTPTSVALPVSPTPLAGTPAQAPIKKSSGAKTTPTHTTTIEAGPNSSLGADGQSAADLSAAAAGALPEGSSPILWESLLGLGALVVLGVAGVWYIKSPSGVDASESLPHGGATDALDSSDFSIDSIDE